MIILTGALLIVLTTSLFLLWYRRDSRLPPGPRGIPILGILPFLGSNPTKKLTEWTNEYHGACTMRIGRTDTVVLANYGSIYDVLIRQAAKMGARADLTVPDAANKGIGIVFATPKISEIHRPFTLQTFRRNQVQTQMVFIIFIAVHTFVGTIILRLGVGKNTMEARIQQEASYLVKAIQDKEENPFDPSRLFLYAAFNISCLITMGERYSYDDKILEHMGSKLVDGLRENGIYVLLIGSSKYLPHFAPFKAVMKRYLDDFNNVVDFFKTKVKEHETTYDENEMRDYIDMFLEEMKKQNPDPTFHKDQLLIALHNIMEAGSQTLSCTLSWCMIALLKYPKYYHILRNEIDFVVGCDRKVSLADRKNMPRTLAFYHELMRRCTLVKTCLRQTVEDGVVVNGYKLPKDTQIRVLPSAVHNDPKCFPDPEKFCPERFIDPEDGSFQKSKYWMPFSIGKRDCIGEQLAQMELFILLVTVIQNFDISVRDDTKIPSLDDGIEGVVFTPPPLDLVFVRRE
uniref:cytochrome P450 2C31-like isoform X3 n=1 Tax=Styela clava TaxID=7725 RepID=UPI001939FFCE|nr:cytochrome P450 2C31-like isoform X3 [Styela clava]